VEVAGGGGSRASMKLGSARRVLRAVGLDEEADWMGKSVAAREPWARRRWVHRLVVLVHEPWSGTSFGVMSVVR
jgi:hypothetical protein